MAAWGGFRYSPTTSRTLSMLGLGVVGAVVLALAGPSDASEEGQPAAWVSWLKLVLGVGLLLVAARQFRGRPHEGEEAPLPRWMGGDRPVLARAGAGRRRRPGRRQPQEPAAGRRWGRGHRPDRDPGQPAGDRHAVFAVVGTLGVGTPVGIYLAMGKRSAELRGGLKDWLGQHNAVIMAVLCLVIGAKLVGDALSGLSA